MLEYFIMILLITVKKFSKKVIFEEVILYTKFIFTFANFSALERFCEIKFEDFQWSRNKLWIPPLGPAPKPSPQLWFFDKIRQFSFRKLCMESFETDYFEIFVMKYTAFNILLWVEFLRLS